ncbi:MAG: EboA domain-containing protein [Pricia sp.]|nr:EboA domain-containing protein [Pricia sp.]
MEFTDINQELESLLKLNLASPTYSWLQTKIEEIVRSSSTKDLYLTYSLLGSKIDKSLPMAFGLHNTELTDYLKTHEAKQLEISRIFLLSKILDQNASYFQPKVANLIQVADTGELETFLKYVVLLPEAENYKSTAVEALRTNITTVFDAISSKNPYPSKFFNDQQWNQMYLKAAFMERDLSDIVNIDENANKELARIISDYAHERWAASRSVDPLFWRPVSAFLDEHLMKDMERLLKSDNIQENRSGALCCFHSDKSEAKELLGKYPELLEQVENGKITWENIKD